VVALPVCPSGHRPARSCGPSGSSVALDESLDPTPHPRAGPARLDRVPLEAVAAALAAPEAAYRASGGGSSSHRRGDPVEDPDGVILVHGRQPLPSLAQRRTLDKHAAGLTDLGGTLPFLRLTLKCHCSTNLILATNSPFQLKNTIQLKNIIPLKGADLDGANLIKAGLSVVNLKGADLRGANLVDAGLQMADLSRSYMTCANLRDAALKEAVLVRAKMGYTDLRGADLIRADLRDADLSGADLSGADLSGANITSEQLNQALSLKDTTMPDGSKHP
jgi:pentapeptide repeat protein